MDGSNFKLVNGQAMTASFTSDKEDLLNFDGFSVQCIYTGSPVGILKLEGTNDDTNYETIPDSSLSISSAGGVLYNCVEQQYKSFRVSYTRTSGSGTFNCFVTLKD